MYRSSLIIGTLFLSGSILLDRITKIQVRSALAVGESVHVAGPMFLTHVENTGSVFGLGQGYVLIPTVASIVILILIPLILRHLHLQHGYVPTMFEAACLGLIAGGAIGNLIDRVVFSAVTDFVDVELLPGFHWPAFNVADVCIVSGTILLLIASSRRGAGGVERNVNV